MLCYTGSVRRNVGLIDTQIELYREGREDTILGMKQLHEIAYAMRDAVEDGDVDELGAMLRDAFVAKRRMNPHIAEHTPIEAMLSMRAGGGRDRREDLRCGRRRLPACCTAVRPRKPPCGGSSSAWGRSSRRSRSVRTGSERSAATRSGRRPPATEEPTMTFDAEPRGRRRAATSARPRTRSGCVEDACLDDIVSAAAILVSSLRAGGKILICGNGGSAADAQHLATEFVSTLTTDNVRPSIPAIALTTDTSLLTAIANDFGAEGMFERQVESLGRQGDVADRDLDERQLRERDPRRRARARISGSASSR